MERHLGKFQEESCCLHQLSCWNENKKAFKLVLMINGNKTGVKDKFTNLVLD